MTMPKDAWDVRRLLSSVCKAAFAGAVLAVLFAGWMNPCLGTARWETCSEGTGSDRATFVMDDPCLGVCDIYLTPGQKVMRLVALFTLILGVAAGAAYFSRSRRGLAAAAAIVLA